MNMFLFMKTKGFFFILFFCLMLTRSEALGNEFGYFISSDSLCTIWWAEGAYKIFRSDPIPVYKDTLINLFSARNEYEPFLLVLKPEVRLKNVRIEISDLTNENGKKLSAGNISIKHVEYVNVTKPTDEFGRAASWPDPLPLYEGPFTCYRAENHPLWITVYVPETVPVGKFRGKIIVSSGNWQKAIPLQLNVWNFALPREATMRSSMGVGFNSIKQYHNLDSEDELKQLADIYFQVLKECRLNPTTPMELYPIKTEIAGMEWEGGEFVSDTVYRGNFALKVADNSASDLTEVKYKKNINIEPLFQYELTGFSMTGKENQQFTVLIKCYNREGKYLPFENLLKTFKGSAKWQPWKIEIKDIVPEIDHVTLHLYPTFKDLEGAQIGVAYFDELVLSKISTGLNLLSGGDFEVDTSKLSVKLDFTDFDVAASRYLDEFGFGSFNLKLEGLPSGSFYSQKEALFGGFRQGTPPYNTLLKQYLSQIQNHLEAHNWLGKEYIYWFDEPNPENYPFVRQGMEIIHQAAPKLTRFITEHQPGPDIMDVSEISCTIWNRIDPAVVADLSKKGREFWSYLCTGPKAPWINLFIDHEAINLRMWLWISYRYQLHGILIWSTTYWNSRSASPKDFLQNPWKDPMSYVNGYGWAHQQITHWGNGDGRLFYPPNRNPLVDKKKYLGGPVNSLRLEILREGLEDYEYFVLLENLIQKAKKSKRNSVKDAKNLLNFPEYIFKNGQYYNKDPRVLLEYRKKIAKTIEHLIEE
jgi:hypothetical protein